MNAPNRSVAVAAWIHDHPEHFLSVPGWTADDVRREALIPLARFLNEVDGGQWGRLVKTDRQNFIPHDILIWKDTKEHFDVFVGTPRAEDTRGAWGVHGVARDAWIWRAVDNAPSPPPLPDLTALTARVAALDVLTASQALRLQEQQTLLVQQNAVLAQVIDRLHLLEDTPPFELPELVAEGSTSRIWGHGHPVRLAVVRMGHNI